MLVLGANQTLTAAAMVGIPSLQLALDPGRYRVEFTPLYNVNVVTTGSGWSFAFSGVLSQESLRASIPRTTTVTDAFNYAVISQNYTSASSPRINNNRCTIVAEFVVTVGGILIPRGRSELAGNAVTLLAGSTLHVHRIA